MRLAHGRHLYIVKEAALVHMPAQCALPGMRALANEKQRAGKLARIPSCRDRRVPRAEGTRRYIKDLVHTGKLLSGVCRPPTRTYARGLAHELETSQQATDCALAFEAAD